MKNIRHFLLFIYLTSIVLLTQAQADYVSGLLIDWHPDGEIIAYTYLGADEVIVVKVETGEILNRITNLSRQNAIPQWSPDGGSLAIVNDKTVEIWDNAWNSESANQVITHQVDVNVNYSLEGVAWNPTGDSLAIYVGQAIFIWDIAAREFHHHPYYNYSSQVWDVVWYSTDYLVIGNSRPYSAIIHAQTGDIIAAYSPPNAQTLNSITGVSLNPDQTLVALVSTLNVLEIWDPAQGEFFVDFGTWSDSPENSRWIGQDIPFSVDWNSTGEYLVTSDQGGNIKIWDANTLSLIEEYHLGISDLFDNVAVWSPDGTHLAFGTSRGGLQIVKGPPVTPLNIAPTNTGEDQ